jgi:hypothetical protein
VSAHLRAQALRFARISVYALLAQLALTGFSWPGWAGLWALVPGALETGLRQMMPTKPIPAVTAVLAAPPEPPAPPAATS